jgi:hypothetical protein
MLKGPAQAGFFVSGRSISLLLVGALSTTVLLQEEVVVSDRASLTQHVSSKS